MKSYIVSLRDLKWLQSATNNDVSCRATLRYGFTAWFDGCAWLCATDTHRLHMVRLGKSGVFTPQHVDLKRLIVEAELAKASHVQVSTDWTKATVGQIAGNGDELIYASPVYAPFTIEDTPPNAAKIVENGCKTPVSEFFAVNIRYLADALSLASDDQNRVVIYAKNKNAVHFIQPDNPSPRWMVALMPMAIGAHWATEAA